MEIVTQELMNRLFAVTDELGLDREAITVPLALEEEGAIRRAGGKIEITLPAGEGLEPFLERLPGLLAGADDPR